jgi:YfiH family protein
VKILDDLAKVSWSGPAARSRLLAARGLDHGFLGRADATTSGMHWARQVHGARLVDADDDATGEAARERAPADGVVTDVRGRRVAVKTADCLPVLYAGARHVAAVHAGWRGLAAGIVGDAARALARRGERLDALTVVVGPAIARERYEVGREVVEALAGPALALAPAAWALAVAKGRGDRWHVDLQLAAVLTLVAHGVPPGNLEVVQACTTDAAWHSYRRDGSLRGSNVHFIAL